MPEDFWDALAQLCLSHLQQMSLHCGKLPAPCSEPKSVASQGLALTKGTYFLPSQSPLFVGIFFLFRIKLQGIFWIPRPWVLENREPRCRFGGKLPSKRKDFRLERHLDTSPGSATGLNPFPSLNLPWCFNDST